MSSKIIHYSLSFRQLSTRICVLSNHLIVSGKMFTRYHASSNTLDNQKSLPESVLIVYDAPSKPSEHLTRRSARSSHSLADYFTSRRRLTSPPARQVSSSTSSTALENSSSNKIEDNQNSLPHTVNVYSETFDSPSKPQAYYVRPQRKADAVVELPQVQVRSFALSRTFFSKTFPKLSPAIFYSQPWLCWVCRHGVDSFCMQLIRNAPQVL